MKANGYFRERDASSLSNTGMRPGEQSADPSVHSKNKDAVRPSTSTGRGGLINVRILAKPSPGPVKEKDHPLT